LIATNWCKQQSKFIAWYWQLEYRIKRKIKYKSQKQNYESKRNVALDVFEEIPPIIIEIQIPISLHLFFHFMNHIGYILENQL
jgi:hypothetical protein